MLSSIISNFVVFLAILQLYFLYSSKINYPEASLLILDAASTVLKESLDESRYFQLVDFIETAIFRPTISSPNKFNFSSVQNSLFTMRR